MGRKPKGPTFDVRIRLPERYQKDLDKKAAEFGISRNEYCKMITIRDLKN